MKKFFVVTEELAGTIKDRKAKKPQGSYTAKLFKSGGSRISQKVGEEAIEMILAAQQKNKKEFIYEVADFWYHLLVLLEHKKVSLDEIAKELKSRYK
jgi:phosphoribosyl-ATP pyrophosphohydrolase